MHPAPNSSNLRSVLILAFGFVCGASASTVLAWMADRLGMATAISSMSIVYVLSGLVLLVARFTTYPRDFVENPTTLEVPTR